MKRLLPVLLSLAVVTLCGFASVRQTAPPPSLPDKLSDQEFWHLITTLSEPEGFFDSDNLVSNEDTFESVIPALKKSVAPGGVYLGVGPDQNFTYITALDAKLAFITDIRRGNLHVHLMYKALIEVSMDRADFLSRLFSRKRPAGLAPDMPVAALFRAIDLAQPDRALFDANSRALFTTLKTTHGFPLEPADVEAIQRVYSAFFAGGPAIGFVSNGRGRSQFYPSFEMLQVADDGTGRAWGYLASDAAFDRLKRLELTNRLVPLVGNFAGPHALKAVGAYLAARGATVSVFYLSNVERYLFQDGLWFAFLDNVAALPRDANSTFIRSCFDSCSSFGESRAISLLDSMNGLVTDARAGRIRSYGDVLGHSHR